MDSIFTWISDLGSMAAPCWSGDCASHKNAVAAILDGIGQLFLIPIRFFIDFILAWMYVYQNR